MIERNKLALTEITAEQYDELMKIMEKPRQHRAYKNSKFGFAKITQPLEYTDYEELLNLFAATPAGRRASIQITKPREKKEWQSYDRENLNQETIATIVEQAYETGLLYISFLNMRGKLIPHVNNEIGFEPINPQSKRVRSTNLEIPGEEKKLYNWNGSDRPYKKILAVYVMPHIAKNNKS